MKIQVLGGHGGEAKGYGTTSYLIDNKILIDAGSVAGALETKDQVAIDTIFISHPHLDHIKDLAFLCDNCFGLRSKPFQVHTHPTVKKAILDHLLNDVIWPDFTKLPTEDKAILKINNMLPEEPVKFDGYTVKGIPVNHPHDAMGFIISKGDTSVLLTLDSGPTDRIWEVAKKTPNLKGIFTEVSFPNSLQNIADLSQHHTSATMQEEIKKMPKGVKVILTHFKPNYREKILEEIEEIGDSRLYVLQNDGEVFNF
jgi:ribonuclease BN (tRNA processing enzyme)